MAGQGPGIIHCWPRPGRTQQAWAGVNGREQIGGYARQAWRAESGGRLRLAEAAARAWMCGTLAALLRPCRDVAAGRATWSTAAEAALRTESSRTDAGVSNHRSVSGMTGCVTIARRLTLHSGEMAQKRNTRSIFVSTQLHPDSGRKRTLTSQGWFLALPVWHTCPRPPSDGWR
jgi:hypothetical protein